MSIQKYQSTLTVTESSRQTEYRLFAQVTKALMDAEAEGEKGKEFIAAIDWNRRLWLMLQMDLVSDENGLTDALKAQLISVAIWVDKHTTSALRGDAKIQPLITVNRAIMEGLAKAPDHEAAGAEEVAKSA